MKKIVKIVWVHPQITHLFVRERINFELGRASQKTVLGLGEATLFIWMEDADRRIGFGMRAAGLNCVMSPYVLICVTHLT